MKSNVPKHVFRLSGGDIIEIPDDLDRPALEALLAELPAEAGDAVLRWLAGTGQGSSTTDSGGFDALVASRVGSNDPRIAHILSRLYRHRDARRGSTGSGAHRTDAPEYGPVLLARAAAQMAEDRHDPPIRILRRPSSEPHDVIVLVGSVTPEELHQAILTLLDLRRTSDHHPSGEEWAEVPPALLHSPLPDSWRGLLATALHELQVAEICDVDSVGSAHSVVFDFTSHPGRQ